MIQIYKAAALMDNDKQQQAIDLLKTLTTEAMLQQHLYYYCEAHLFLADIATMNKDFATAKQYLDKILSIEKEKIDAHKRRAIIKQHNIIELV